MTVFDANVASLYTKTMAVFINQLQYWAKKNQGVVWDSRRWIYNTGEEWAAQCGCTRRNFTKFLSKLIEDGVIEVQKLHPNKRNRTNYYWLNQQKLDEMLRQKGGSYVASPPPFVPNAIENPLHIVNTENTNIKDYKYINTRAQAAEPAHAGPIFLNQQKKEVKEGGETPTAPSNFLKVQEIVQLASELLGDKLTDLKLDKRLARLIGGARKFKLPTKEAVLKYLEIVKSSSFIMSSKFKLTLRWLFRFDVIDQLRTGWLGAQPERESVKSVDEEKAELEAAKQKALEHVASVDESDDCKALRLKIIEHEGPKLYNAWMTDVRLRLDNQHLDIEGMRFFVDKAMPLCEKFLFFSDMTRKVVNETEKGRSVFIENWV